MLPVQASSPRVNWTTPRQGLIGGQKAQDRCKGEKNEVRKIKSGKQRSPRVAPCHARRASTRDTLKAIPEFYNSVTPRAMAPCHLGVHKHPRHTGHLITRETLTF
ncbi:hypothetical protein HAX54_051461 [Datura stramonium]|uniref:Uncharacterized protein n=1 Tax=Datura stramonium TaxID=4076 RepID=A0ABS8SXQ1_DATST|nr:hypothetical protein [Datura stramonium]